MYVKCISIKIRWVEGIRFRARFRILCRNLIFPTCAKWRIWEQIYGARRTYVLRTKCLFVGSKYAKIVFI